MRQLRDISEGVLANVPPHIIAIGRGDAALCQRVFSMIVDYKKSLQAVDEDSNTSSRC